MPRLRPELKSVVYLFATLALLYAAAVAFVYVRQRQFLYFPSHSAGSSTLQPWLEASRFFGYCREVPGARTIWLMTHGNAGQARDRDYVLPRLAPEDSLYVLEYPGYGLREGSPSRESMNAAALEAYQSLRARFPHAAICALGESIGSGPAASLALASKPPDKIVLVVPFDTLVDLGARHMPFLPVRLILRDRWDNVSALQRYTGPVEIFAAVGDTIIPPQHAKALAEKIPGAQLHLIRGGHNDWSFSDQVRIRR